MTTYRGIKGLGIQNITSDAVSSQMGGGTWASAPAINTGRHSAGGAGATQSAAYIIGGKTTAIVAIHEQYNGTAWTEAADLGTAKYILTTFGTTTSALTAGGYDGVPPTSVPQGYTTNVESWNGSSWTETTDINTIRAYAGASGSSNTSGVVYGGQFPTGNVDNTESWNGSAWTETGDLNTARYGIGQTNNGTTTAAMCSGGDSPLKTNVEQFNGSSWTEVSDINTARWGPWGIGTTTLALIAGGRSPSYVAITESWDGTSWTEVSDLGTASSANTGSGSGTATSGIVAAQSTGSPTTNSEEWTAPATFRKFNVGDIYYNADPSSGVIKYTGYSQPTGTWASGGNMNTARSEFIGSNISKTSHAIAAGGPSAIVEQYDGTSWSEIADVNTQRLNGAGMGRSPNACLLAGGQTDKAEVEEYNGSSWTELSDINSARRNAGQAGTTTAGLIFGGNVPSGSALTELWNGSSWSETGDLNTGRGETDGNGISTSAICVGGEPNTQHVEEWNGSAWSEVSEINVGTEVSVTAGANAEDALNYSGGPPRPTTTEYWNGSSWTETGDLAVGVQAGTGGGTHSSEAWLAGGYGGSPAGNVATTQEWSAGAGLKTLASTNA